MRPADERMRSAACSSKARDTLSGKRVEAFLSEPLARSHEGRELQCVRADEVEG